MLTALTFTTMLTTQPARAEEASNGAAEDQRTIVVTARKQVEPLAKVGAPVSVLSGEAVRDGQIVAPDQLAERFVSLTVLPNATGNLLFIRGVGGFTLTANAEPAVGWNYDGVFVARPMGTNGQMFDLDRVELLKGPQGALHGRNATGGAVNLIPRVPEAGQTKGHLGLSYGSYSAFQAEAMANLPLGDNGAVRVSALLTGQDNYLVGLQDGPRQLGVRVQFGGELAAGLSVKAAGDYTRLGGVPLGTGYRGKYVLDRATGTFGFVPSNLDRSLGTRSTEGQAFRQTIFLPTLGRNLDAQQSEPGQDHDFYGAHVEIKADLGFAELSLLPAWRFADIDGIAPGAPFDYLHRETQEQKTLEARLAGKAGPLDWLIGAYLFGETVQVDYANNFSTSLSFFDQRYKTTSRAGFAQATWNMSPKLRLGGGLRITDERKITDSAVTQLTLSCPVTPPALPNCVNAPLLQLYSRIGDVPFAIPGPGQPPIPVRVNGVPTGALLARSLATSTGTWTDTAVTWRGLVEADISDTAMVYASVANGFRPGGTNAATGFETYRPEQLIAYTIGARWRGGGGRFNAALESFWWDYRDQHVTALQPDLTVPTPRSVNITRNIGRSRIRGFDFELNARPLPQTNAYIQLQYLDSRYLDNTFPQVSTAGVPLTGCSAVRQGTTTLYIVDCTGQRPFASPKWTLGLGLRQGFDIGRLRLEAMARTRYQSSMMAGTAFLPQQLIPAYWNSHAQLILSHPDRRWELAAYVHNIENGRNTSFVIFHPASNALVASSIPPRTWGLRGFVRF